MTVRASPPGPRLLPTRRRRTADRRGDRPSRPLRSQPGARGVRRGARGRATGRAVDRRPHLPPGRALRGPGSPRHAGPPAAARRRRAARRRGRRPPPHLGRRRARQRRLRRGPDPPPGPDLPGRAPRQRARSTRSSTGSSRPRCERAGGPTPGSTARLARSPTSPSTGSRGRPARSTGRPILVAGVGRMGRLAAFAAHRRGRASSSRTGPPTVRPRLPPRSAGRPCHSAGDGVLPPVDGAIVALAGPWRVGPADAAALVRLGRRGRRPLVAAVREPATSRRPSASRFTSVDDLTVAPEFEPQDRLRRRLEKLVSPRPAASTARGSARATACRSSRPLTDRAETPAARRARTGSLIACPTSRPTSGRVVEQMSHRLVAALLHAPLAALHDDEAGSLERAARDLFGV